MGANPLNLAPSLEHPLGTEGFGRDMFTVMVIGIPNTFKIGFLAGAVAYAIGVQLIGLFAGYYKGSLDTVFSSFADVMLVIPALAILITVSAYVRVMTVEMMALIVGLLAWPLPARIDPLPDTQSARAPLCGQVAKLSGQNDFEIIFLQILPNLTAYLAAAFVGAVSTGILAAVGLEVLGLGPQTSPPSAAPFTTPSHYSAMFRGMWWWWGPPIVTLAIIFTGLFLIERVAGQIRQSQAARVRAGTNPGSTSQPIDYAFRRESNGNAKRAQMQWTINSVEPRRVRTILEVKDLRVTYHTRRGPVRAVNGVSFYLRPGRTARPRRRIRFRQDDHGAEPDAPAGIARHHRRRRGLAGRQRSAEACRRRDAPGHGSPISP